MDDKLVYTVTGPVGGSIEAFTDALVTEVGPDLGKVLPAGTRVRARVRDAGYPERFAGSPWLASMPYRGEQLAVDAVLDVLAPEPAEELDEAHAVLDEAMTTFQGWRVAATTNIDLSLIHI